MGDSVVKTAPQGYTYDAQGNLVHMVYDEGGHAELGIKGTVIPSAKVGGEVGGNVAFDPHDPNIPQNIVECTPDGMRVITKMTRAEMAVKQGGSVHPVQEVPAAAPFPGQKPVQVVGGAAGQLSVSLSNRGGDMAKKKAKKKTKKSKKKISQRGEKSPEEPAVQPVPVVISGVFGQIVQHFSIAFKDGNQVILGTDTRQLPAAYKFPELADNQPIPLQLSWAGQTVQCLWAGIHFTLPDGSVTFSILFVNEESSPDGQGLAGEAGSDQV
jgi:hypothetical protein